MNISFDERYNNLNKQQKLAVDTTDGPVMVIAGPGSGKTELLSLRVGKILIEGSAKAPNILCLTFTETAARNMRERLESLIGADAYRVAIYTFHSFCTDIIARYPEYFFSSAHFRPASDLIQSEVLQNIFERLPHKHILGSFHPEMGYSYLKESQMRIKDIKKGGFTPERFEEILKENESAFTLLNKILQEHLPERIGKDSYVAFTKLKEELEKTNTLIGNGYASSIQRSLDEVLETEKNTPLSNWKSKYTGKDESGNRLFKDSINLPKLFALVEIYKSYQETLHKEGYFDYEDMILEVVEALKKNIKLRTELEEMYQYIMVDEFQDTNNAQLSLVKGISSNEVHEGRPNVCVVGDDDQAIYKFQGAEMENMLSFKQLYKDVEVIVLTENYRSTQKILDFSRSIVTQGINRLENRYKEIRKDLKAKNPTLLSGEIHTLSFKSQEEEFAYIANEIRKLLDKNTEAKEVAVIAREHKQLTNILPYLDSVHVPYTYTRKENVFDEIHVKELITLCRYLSSVSSNTASRDDLLPEILSFPFWGISRIDIWTVAEYAKKENTSWLSAMQSSNNKYIKELSSFLIEVGTASINTPLEIILDTLIGSRGQIVTPESEYDDENTAPHILPLETNFTSPYKNYYFGENTLKKNVSSYIHFLSSLKVFIHALREYKQGEQLYVKDVGDFIDIHISYNIPLINNTPFAHNENSVQLLTAHGAKGLEFSYVFVISVNDSIWAGGSKGNKLSFPINLPLASAGDDEDDFIRLFYVALTRARHTLYLTHNNSPFRFLQHPLLPETNTKNNTLEINETLAEGLQVAHIPPFTHDEKALLQKVVENYTLSPTHLNNFLDLAKGGPIKFLEQNLLRFPQAKTASSVYGTAIHKALEDMYIITKKENKVPALEKIYLSFNKELAKGRLHDYEVEKYKNRGEKILSIYYNLNKNKINKENIVELNFAKQSVMMEGALLTGKIDKIISDDENNWIVVDLKTGKGFSDWEGSKQSKFDEIKLHHYRNQLMMYKLLVENSRDYSNKNVISGVLEFVEENMNDKTLELELNFNESNEELKRCKDLAIAVYKKIVTLNFPDTSNYQESLDGIKEFEEDLISGRI